MRKLFTLFIVIFLTGLTVNSYAQLTVSVTGATNTTPNLSTSYTSLLDALAAINAITGMSGPVVFTLATGSETAPVKGFVLGSASLNPLLNETNTITINTSGIVFINAGVGNANPNSPNPDGMFVINGADYVTLDGITFYDGNALSPASMEFGIGLFKRAANDGCNFVTIQNCTLNLRRLHNSSGSGPMVEGSVAIGVYNSTHTAATTALTPTNGGTLATNGSNSNNKFYSNTIVGCNYGIVLSGAAAGSGGPSPNPLTFTGDLNNDIGGNSILTGNLIENFGGGHSDNPSAGIRVINQWSVNISYNTLNNNNGTGSDHPGEHLRGIYAQSGFRANATISDNNITLSKGGDYGIVTGIQNGIGNNRFSNTVNIINNTISAQFPLPGIGGIREVRGIYCDELSNPEILNIQNNIIQDLSYGSASTTFPGTIYPIYSIATFNNTISINVTGNIINNVSILSSLGGSITGIYIPNSNLGLTTNVIDNSISNLTIDGAGEESSIKGIEVRHANVNVVGNSISNLVCLKTTGTSPIYGIYNDFMINSRSETYSNNIIHSITHHSTAAVYGIFCDNLADNRTISGNTIYNLNSPSTEVVGITSRLSRPNIFNNKIYELTTTSNLSIALVRGIDVFRVNEGQTTNVYNNLIGNLYAPVSNGQDVVRAINLTLDQNNSTAAVSHNSIYLSGTSSASNFGSSGIFALASLNSHVGNLILRNNLIVNHSTPKGTGSVVALRRGTSNFENFDPSSNYNLYYAGIPGSNNLIYSGGTALTNFQTMEVYRNSTLIAPRDSVSFSYLPAFLSLDGSSADFLRVDNSIPTPLESGGTIISSITHDIEGTPRYPNIGYPEKPGYPPTAPDVGAYEFGGEHRDLIPPKIVYTPFLKTTSTAARTLTATITDASGVPFAGIGLPRLYWSINNIAGPFTESIGTHSVDNDFDFIFGAGVTAGDIVYYYITAQDNATIPNVLSVPVLGSGGFTVNPPAASTPPTSPSSYQVLPAFSGTIFLGTGETYTSLTENSPQGLFKAINEGAITGDVTIQVMTDLVETGAVMLNKTYEESMFTISIVPGSESMKTISGNSAGGLIKINAAENITFDGRFNGSGSYLTIQNTNAATNSAVFHLRSNGIGAGVNNITIRNCNIVGGSTTHTSAYGIFIGGSSVSPGISGANNNNITIRENKISKANVGIVGFGVSGAGISSGLSLLNNEIGSDISTERIGSTGLSFSNFSDALISDNTVFGIIGTNTNSRGMHIGTGMTNSSILNNTIHSIIFNGAGPNGARGIEINTNNLASNLTFANNVVYNILGNGSNSIESSSIVGIRVTGNTGGLNFYYNSVNLSGNANFFTIATLSAAIYFPSGSTDINLVNNIFVNTIENTLNPSSKAYTIYNAGTNAIFGTINYNDYFRSGSQNVLGYLSGDIPTLILWRAATGQDVNSTSQNPLFINEELQLSHVSPLLGAGTPIPGITTDKLGVTRSATAPTIGAYEQGVLIDVGISSVVSPLNGQIIKRNGSIVTAYLTNFGNQIVNNVNVFMQFRTETPIGPVVIPGPLNPGDSTLVTFSGANQFTSAANNIGDLFVYSEYPGDVNAGNNSKRVFHVTAATPVTSFPFFETWNTPVYWTTSGTAMLWHILFATNPSGVAGDPVLRANFYSLPSGQQLLKSPVIDLTGMSNPMLAFYVAYTTYSLTPTNDVIQVFVSTNGGVDHQPAVFNKGWSSIPSLATVPPQEPEFFPGAANHWRHEIIDLSAYAGQEIVIAFNAITAWGNSAWIDNIKIADVDNISLINVNSPGLYGNLTTNGVQINFTALRPGLGNGMVQLDGQNTELTFPMVNVRGWDDVPETKESTIQDKSQVRRSDMGISPDASQGVLALSRVDDFPINNTYATNVSATTFSGAIFTPDIVANRYWEIAFSGDDYVSTATYDIIIDISTQLGIVDPDRLYIMKRIDQNAPWVCVSTITEYEMGLPVRLIASGLQGFSQFGIGAEDGTLPVDLVEFNATVDRNNVILNWTTAWEENNMKFDIQRRPVIEESATWQTVGSVAGSGTTQEEKSYSYADKNLVTGKYEYRLIQIDFDGNSTSDHTLSSQVEVGVPAEFALSQNYPNPFNPMTKIDFQIPVEGLVKLIVYDISGREVATLVNQVKTPGYYQTEFNGANFASGVYFYRLVTNNNVMTKKFMLLK